jgi:ribosomal protein RSM22 (predicted rRNA methylase)
LILEHDVTRRFRLVTSSGLEAGVSRELPAALRAALTRELEGVSRKELAGRARLASDAYRAGRGSAGVIREDKDALAYALTRLPATFAACAAAFEEAAARAPAFAPARLLDAGAGPGAASWAAVEAWSALESITWLDESPSFLDLAGRLAGEGPAPLAAAERRRLDLAAAAAPFPTADLVACSYALAEIAPARQAAVVDALWAACAGLLVLVEPGTPAGFERLRAARTALIAAGAHILGPCPHAHACPMVEPDWCHFAVRLPRSRDHLIAKGAEVPFEDEPFAYLLAARPGLGEPAPARVLAPPRHGKAAIELKLCTPAGIEMRAVARRDRAGFAAARRLDWGDAAG